MAKKDDDGCGCSWWMWLILCLILYGMGKDEGYRDGYSDAQQGKLFKTEEQVLPPDDLPGREK